MAEDDAPAGVAGPTDELGGAPVDRKLVPGDLLASIYQVLGIDRDLHLLDAQKRPVNLLAEGQAISELFA